MDYPEHEKQRKVLEKSHAIGEFLDWLECGDAYDRPVRLACTPTQDDLESGHRFVRDNGLLIPFHMSKQRMLAKFFDIDETKLEEEKQAMLDECRRQNAAG